MACGPTAVTARLWPLVQLQVPRPLPLLLLAVVLWTGQAENHLPL